MIKRKNEKKDNRCKARDNELETKFERTVSGANIDFQFWKK